MPSPPTAATSLGFGDFVDALQQAHATSEPNAVPLADLPTIPVERLGVFLEANIIREGAPGTYYLTSAEERMRTLARPSPPYTPLRVALMMAVWLVAIAVPFVVWLIAR